MKKFYSLLGAVAFTLTVNAQSNTALYKFNEGTKMLPAKNLPNATKNTSARVSGGVVSKRVDPMANMWTIRGGNMGTSIGSFYTELNCDSLARFTYGSGPVHITTHMAGIVFDPQSETQGDGSALFSKYDPYTIDTLWIGGVYNRVSASSVVDTLVVDVAWADTTTNSVFYRFNFPTTHDYGRFGGIIAPKFAVTTPTAHGLQQKLAAPASSSMRYKIPLNVSDTDVVNNIAGYKMFELPTALNIPANARVAIVYTYVTGMPYVLGDVMVGGAGNPQTVNSWAPRIYSQTPQPASAAATLDYFNDLDRGKNQGVAMYDSQRYGTISSTLVQSTALYSQFSAGYWIDISLHGNSSVGVKELAQKGFSLGQNTPNPFTGTSNVSYELQKEASSVTFTVTDVMGRVVSSQKAEASKGVHTVTLENYAAGVYYYSLNVDGNITTKKMIAQ